MRQLRGSVGSFIAGTPAEAKGPVCAASESIIYEPDDLFDFEMIYSQRKSN